MESELMRQTIDLFNGLTDYAGKNHTASTDDGEALTAAVLTLAFVVAREAALTRVAFNSAVLTLADEIQAIYDGKRL